MNFHDTYQFTLTTPAGSAQVYPIQDYLAYKYEFDKDVCSHRLQLDENVLFGNVKDKNSMAFDLLWQTLIENPLCPDVDLKIQKWCDGQLIDAFDGKVNTRAGVYDKDTCTASLQVNANDPLSCITDIWENESNWLEFDTETITSNAGELQCEECFENASNPILTWSLQSPPMANSCGYGAAEGWIMTGNELYGVTEVPSTVQGAPSQYQAENGIRTTYCRWFSPTDPGGWIAVPGGFALPVGVNYSGYQFSQTNGATLILNATLLDITIDNVITFETLLDRLFPDCNICSDFLGINPIGDAPNNIAYQFAQAYLQNLVFAQPSDVIRASATGNAIFFFHNFKCLWDDLKKIFNLKMFYDKDTDCIRIEHVTWRKNNELLDLTKYLDGECLEGHNKIEFDDEDFPRREEWKYAIISGDSKFDNAFVYYDNNCTNGETEECEMEKLGADLVSMYDNPQFEGTDFESDGIFMIATDGNGVILNNNDNLGMRCIIENLHIWNRPFIEGVMNNQVFTFLSIRAAKKMGPIQLPFCCSDFFENLDPTQLVVTHCGRGEITDLLWVDYGLTGSLELELSIQ